MKAFLLLAGFIAAMMFGLSAVAAPVDGVRVDTQYLAPSQMLVLVDQVQSLGPRCTPSAAQAAKLTITYILPAEAVANPPCAMPGGASPGVGTAGIQTS